MKAALRLAITGMGILAAAGGMAQSPALALGNLQVKEVNLAEIDKTHVKLAVDLSLTPAQSATVENLRLCSLHLNGLPVYAAPINQQLVLKKGVATALPPAYVTVLFRDVRSTEPLRKMIEKQSVRVEGELVADLRLTLLEKLALHTEHPRVEVAIGEDVPANVGGTELERNMELTILGVIDSGLEITSAASKYLPNTQPQWIRDLEATVPANLFAVESSYTLTQGDASYPVDSVQLGFLAAPSAVVATAETQAPWKYDLEFLSAMESGTAKLTKNSLEIRLRPLGEGDPLRLSAKDFKAETRGIPEEDNVIAPKAGGHDRIKILSRTAPSSLAVLKLHAPFASSGLTPAPAAVLAQQSWEQIAVFRLRVDAATKKPSVEVLQMEARHEGQGIRLSQPVDAAVYGSPIVTPDGVIGLVQDEQTGAFLPADLLAPPAPPVPVPAPVQ